MEWLNLTVAWVIRSDLVSLTFIQHSNDSDTENDGEAYMCYI